MHSETRDPAQQDPNNLELEMKYFDVGSGYVCAQLSTQMDGAGFQNLIGEAAANAIAQAKARKAGRVMFLCLDKSGSMSGAPFKAL